MEISYEEQLNLDNSREHLKVVQSNLRIASDELNKVLVALGEAKDELTTTRSLKELIAAENSDLIREIAEIRSAQDRRESILLEKENRINELDKEFELKISDSKKELDDTQNKTSAIKIENNILMGTYSSLVVEFETRLNTLRTNIEEYEKEIEEKSRVRQGIENEITRLNSQSEEAKKELNRFKLKSDEELISIGTKIEDEKNKIRNPLMLLGLENEKLERKSRNLEIIKARLTKQFRQLNPDKILPLELQNE